MTHLSTPIRPILLLLAFCSLVLASFAAPVKFDLPAQPATTALPAFIQQSGTQVMFVQDELKNVRTNAVSGEYEPFAALGLLVKGTGFAASRRDGGWFAVVRAVPDKPGSIEGSVRDESGKPVAGAKVALADSDKAVATDKRGRFILTEVPAGAHVLQITAEGLQNTRVTDVTVNAGRELSLSPITVPVRKEGTLQLEDFVVSAKKNDGVLELDPFAVEGQKIKPFVSGNMDIPRTINDAQPYYVFDAKTIDTSGATNVEDFLKQRLTMNTVALTNGQNGGRNLAGNTSTINLRGLGADKTLILVNGRRMPGVVVDPFAGTQTQPDLNGIPVNAIERIEVLPSSASGIYGGSAIGGVVNVILKKNYVGGEVRATYDNTWDTDSPRRNLAMNYGMTLEGGKTHLSVNAAWMDAEPMLLQDRVGIFQDNLAILLKNSPTFTSQFSSRIPWLGSLPNVTDDTGSVTNLTFKPEFGGGTLGSNMTFVPAGTSATTLAADLAAGLRANAGKWNLDLPVTAQPSTGLLRRLGVTPKTTSFGANISRQMLPSLEVFVDYSHSTNKSVSIHNPMAVSSTRIPAGSPKNPFTTDIAVRFPDASMRPLTTSSQNDVVTIGALAKLPWNWTALADYTWSKNAYGRDHTENDTLGKRAAEASGALNYLVDTLKNPLDWSNYVRPESSRGSSELQSFSTRAAGALPSLPWGSPNLTVGLERRISTTPENTYFTDYPITVASSRRTTFYRRESTIDSGYAEATIPLVKSDALAGIRELELQVSGRSERFTVDTGTPYQQTAFEAVTPTISYGAPTLNGQPFFAKTSYTSRDFTVGLKYQPIQDVTIRVSRATAFLPPTPAQLLQNPFQSTTTTSVVDPVTNQPSVPVFTIAGGNPSLRPQSSKSFNAGIIWAPKWQPLDGLRLNVEYYRIEQFDAIGSLTAQSIVNQESLFPGRVTRNSAGTITLVDISLVNLYHRETEGWDVNLDYSINTPKGRFIFGMIYSTISQLKSQYAQTLPEFDAAGYHYGESGAGAPKNKANAFLNWEWERWSAGWSSRYTGSYKMYGAAGGPDSVQFANGAAYQTVAFIIPQGSDTVVSQVYHDVFVGYAFGKRSRNTGGTRGKVAATILSDLKLQVGLRNVFDQAPALDAYQSDYYYASPYGDLRLRSYWLSVTKSF